MPAFSDFVEDLAEATNVAVGDIITILQGGVPKQAAASLLFAGTQQTLTIGTGDWDGSNEYTVGSGYSNVVIFCTTGDTDRTLILPVTAGTRFTILKVDSGTGKLTVEGVTGTINGGASLILPYQYSACELTGDATNLFILSTCNVWRPEVIWTGSETTGTHSLDSGAFSDYDLLVFYGGNAVYELSEIISIQYWTTFNRSLFVSGTSSFVSYGYISDTSFAITDYSTFEARRIEGVKL